MSMFINLKIYECKINGSCMISGFYIKTGHVHVQIFFNRPSIVLLSPPDNSSAPCPKQ